MLNIGILLKIRMQIIMFASVFEIIIINLLYKNVSKILYKSGNQDNPDF